MVISLETLRALDDRRICQFVRDGDYYQHTMPALVHRFGHVAIEGALTRGLIERQLWQGEPSHFVDLTALGSEYLRAFVLRRMA